MLMLENAPAAPRGSDRPSGASTRATLEDVQLAGEDFEWYPTTQRMIDVVAKQISKASGDVCSIMDIGAGDGRVLVELSKKFPHARLYGIEKSTVLLRAQPEDIIPVGTDFYEQNLTCLPADYIFCNPPYSQFEAWASAIIESGFAKKSYLVIPRRWKDSEAIKTALERRKAEAKVIHSDDFLDAERAARAVVDIVEIAYPMRDRRYFGEPEDPFDVWFNENISTFDQEEEVAGDDAGRDLAKNPRLDTIAGLVEAFDAEYARMEENYRAIFKLDHAILKELGVSKDAVREGIKKRMAGLKTKYWELLFERLNSITDRLSTATKERFLKRLTDRTSIAFTATNAYAVVIWAVKHANRYYNEQLIALFKDLSTFEGVLNYKSNQRTWERSQWRFMDQKPTHYGLDYRIVVCRSYAIKNEQFAFDYTNDLHNRCHDLIADIIAVMGNLGFLTSDTPSRYRHWVGGEWQDFYQGDTVLFQVKAYKNGNLHLRFRPEAIKAMNVEAGRLLGWIRSASDVVEELGYTAEEATKYFHTSLQIAPSNVKLLAAG
jgi:hypothetical protein